jgi:hypothetical protein
VDAETEEPLAVFNILIQIVQMRVVDARAGYRDVATVGSGDGFFATGGLYYPVRWAKAAHNAPMRWYFLCGTPLVLTPGKTWVCVLQNTENAGFK